MLQIPKENLKKLLITDGILPAGRFDSFSKEAKRQGKTIGEVLIGEKIITESYYNGLVSKFYNVPLTSLTPNEISTEVLVLISEEMAREKRLVPFSKNEKGDINVAMENPSDLETIEFLEKKFGAKVKPFLANNADLSRVYAFYGKQQVEGFKKIIQDNIQASLKLTGKKDVDAAVEVPIIAITDNILSYAMSLRASDVHIEALEKEILIRYRIDGILHEIIRIQKEIHSAIVARFKILSQMKLDEHSKPQDGRFRHKLGNENIDIRASVLPTLYGEKVELRLLVTNTQILSFEELGMLPEMIKTVKESTAKSYGVILVTGPTGSGKSTTLYSILHSLNKPEVNIVTVEDPIEYDMQYINQTQINEAAGVTFASSLRSILRQDPNIIMVGEVRDEETAEISMHAALTGHLVLTSLHTNDAPTAIPRLMDMHIPPFLLAAVVSLIMAQRLVRRLCLECMFSYPTTPEILTSIESELKKLDVTKTDIIPKTLFKAKGCASCSNTGYRGRIGIYESLVLTDEIRAHVVSENFSLEELQKLAREAGMKTMFEDGLIKARQGNTTIEEVFRVIRE